MLHSCLRTALLCLITIAADLQAQGQTATPMPHDYRGVDVRAGGIFVTPVSNAPFSATADIVSKEKLPDGSLNIRTSVAHIARDGEGRIYNERRALVSSEHKGDPILLSALIYDPTTRTSTFLNPFDHLARQRVLQQPRPAESEVPLLGPHAYGVLSKQESLGDQILGNVLLKGTKKVWTVPGTASGTGKPVEIIDQYWYSPDLSIYLIIQHDDPRTGEQIVAVKDISRNAPDESLFTVPVRYKVVDETPVP